MFLFKVFSLFVLHLVIQCAVKAEETHRLEEVDTSCNTTEHCYEITDSICDVADQKCKCGDNQVISSDFSRCLTISLGYNDVCVDSRQCSQILQNGGACVEGVCKCTEGFHYFHGQCWKSVGLGGVCRKAEECYVDSNPLVAECKAGVCRCADGHYNREYSSCRKKSGLVSGCLIDKDCQSFLSKSQCSKLLRKCVPSVSDLLLPRQPARPVHSSQLQSDVCVENCTRCDPGYFLRNGSCLREIGTSCSTDEDCSVGVEFSECSKGVCSCQTNVRVPSLDLQTCRKVANGKITDFNQTSCLYDEQCNVFGQRSRCLEKVCSCTDGSHWDPDEKLCWVSKLPGEVCQNLTDCSGVRNMSCVTSSAGGETCQCDKSFHTSSDNKECRPDGLKVGDSCKENSDCLFNLARCESSTETCQCIDNYFDDNGLCKSGLGFKCTNDSDCHVTHSSCRSTSVDVEESCTCDDDFVEAGKFSLCLPGVGYQDECAEDSQCTFSLGSLSYCSEFKKCECSEGSYHKNVTCFTKRGLGESCKAESECYVESEGSSAVCQNGVCRCKYGFITDSKSVCKSSAYFLTPVNALLSVCLFYVLTRAR